jgi:hypothetical protein
MFQWKERSGFFGDSGRSLSGAHHGLDLRSTRPGALLGFLFSLHVMSFVIRESRRKSLFWPCHTLFWNSFLNRLRINHPEQLWTNQICECSAHMHRDMWFQSISTIESVILPKQHGRGNVDVPIRSFEKLDRLFPRCAETNKLRPISDHAGLDLCVKGCLTVWISASTGAFVPPETPSAVLADAGPLGPGAPALDACPVPRNSLVVACGLATPAFTPTPAASLISSATDASPRRRARSGSSCSGRKGISVDWMRRVLVDRSMQH